MDRGARNCWIKPGTWGVNMTRWKKVLTVLCGLIFSALVLFFVLAKVLITPERVRDSIVPMVAESLHRDLQLGEIEISLFSGIVLNDVILSERAADTPFISIEKAVLRYRLWPLLLLQVQVDELRLVRPRIEIVQYADGKFNFSDISGAKEGDVQKIPTQESSTKKGTIAVKVSEIVITDGALQYVHQTAGESGTESVTSVNFSAHDFSLTEPFQLSLAADWESNALSLNGTFDLDDLSTDVRVRMNAVQLKVKGDLLAEAKGERLRGTIKLPATPVDALLGSLPKGVLTLPAGLTLSGEVAAELVLDGLISEPAKLLSSAEIKILNLASSFDSIQAGLNGTFLLEREVLKTDGLKLKLNDQPLDISLRIEDLMKQPLKGSFAVQAPRIDLNKLFPVADAAPSSVQDPASCPQRDEIGPFDLPVDLSGEVLIEEILYRDLPLQKVELRLTLKKNRLIIERLTALVAGGKFEQTASVDLGVEGFRYQGHINFQEIQAHPIVKVFRPALSESLFAVVDGEVELSGEGTVPEVVKKRLNAQANVTLKQGKLTNIPLLDSAAALLAVSELKEVIIDSGRALLRLDKGVVNLDIQTLGPQFNKVTVGTVSLSGPLDLKVNLALSPQLSQKLDRRKVLGELLTDRSGWTHIPLRVKGETSSPEVTLDMAKVREQAKQGAVDKLSERLKKELNRGKNGSQPSASDDPTSRLIDSALKGLFGQ